MNMYAVRLPSDMQRRLEAQKRRTGQPKSRIVREAVQRYLEDLEDADSAARRLKHPARRVSMAEAKKALGLDG
ncbi:ribbon-helix-helix protein, CopG family [Ferrovibrio sp.]|uniref:type II toxin-antitoxin system RelB family antitoxin n=2 Tax=Ferrovibrio sp. TaxID=1917215 RepID=UPI00345CFABA